MHSGFQTAALTFTAEEQDYSTEFPLLPTD